MPCGDSTDNQQGLDAMEFSDVLISAAVMLDWSNLEFKGGFVGVERLIKLGRACRPHQNPHCKQTCTKYQTIATCKFIM